MFKIDIEKALSLPTGDLAMKIGDKYCAVGGAVAGIEGETVKEGFAGPAHAFSPEIAQLIIDNRLKFDRIIKQNDTAKDEIGRQIARRLAVQAFLETGKVVPVEKDIELARELLATKLPVAI
jgi:hypothetical protein